MLRWLDSLTRADSPLVGAKAARLGELAASGLPVPAGFVLDVTAYRAAVAAHGPLAEALAQAAALDEVAAEQLLMPLFMRMPLPAELEAAVGEALERLGEGPVAVRSSAPGEDGEGASFAGQQRTFLNARGAEQVLRCLRACWAGAWGAGVAAYRRRLADGARPEMAVVVQRLIVAEAAGVAFTAHPVTGERDRIVVDAAFGLGEAVVAGLTTPDRAVIARADGALLAYDLGEKAVEVSPASRGTEARPVAPARRAARALEPAAIAALHDLALRVEALLGPGQDLEFAWADGRVHLLQARPITALPPAPPAGGWVGPAGVERAETARWERRNFAEHLPGALSPLAESLILPAVAGALARLAASIGLRLPEPGLCTIHGWAYARTDMRPLAAIAWRAPRAYAALLFGDPRYWQRSRWLGPPPPSPEAGPQADAPARVAAIEAWVEAFAETWADVHRLSAGWRWSELAVRLLVGDEAWAGLLLTSGAEPPFAEAIAALVPRDEAQRRALAADDPVAALGEVLGDAEAAEARFAAALALAEDMPASLDPLVPLPFATPRAIADLALARADDAGAVARRVAADARAREAWARTAELSAWRRLALARVLPWARRFAEEREVALATLGAGWGAFREALLALGAALAARGALDEPEAVFWLSWPELRALALAGGRADAEAIAAARQQHAQRQALAPPRAIEARPAAGGRLPAGAILGIPASGGRARGPARLVLGPADFQAFRPGEVLVAPTTTPAHTPLFALAAAIVTDVGGPLSHGSIVAREFGIPAVLGTEAATRRLRDGQRVVVDGDRGVVWAE